jgi:hypothetical protein
MQAYTYNLTVQQKGTLTLRNLPFSAGEEIEVIIIPRTKHAQQENERYHLDPTALLPPKQQQRPEELKDWQKEKWAACLGVVREVHKLEADGTSRNQAIETFCSYFRGGFFPSLLAASRTKTLSTIRVLELCLLYKKGGELALMPADRSMPKRRIDEWLPYFLRIWRDRDTGKNGRSLSDCYRQLEDTLPKKVQLPSESHVRKTMAKMSSVERNKGSVVLPTPELADGDQVETAP